jgi:2-C-methyl-D-erythritol 2,4-cyclodiphosphate synthase
MEDIRVGFGYDVHRLAAGRELWIGGVQFEHPLGSLGHSDADVLLHAICDALLGAAGMRDIGFHFPDTDPTYKGIDSKKLLHATLQKLFDEGWKIGNIDATLVLEKPKIMHKVVEMKQVIAGLCEITPDRVAIKATTSETMGFVGKEEGLEASAVVLIMR